MRRVFAVMSFALLSLPVAADNAALSAEASSIVQRFAGTLQPQLLEALQQGGPAKAIEVCSVKAGEISAQLSAETGWQVRRVSLKSRNAKSGVPDSWEEKVLLSFEARKKAGEPVDQLIHAEVVEGRFRFMKAQGVKPLCLTCHGENLAPEVKEALAKRYPQDSATGYREGDIRGAFTLSRPHGVESASP
jgi:hypothetical protein